MKQYAAWGFGVLGFWGYGYGGLPYGNPYGNNHYSAGHSKSSYIDDQRILLAGAYSDPEDDRSWNIFYGINEYMPPPVQQIFPTGPYNNILYVWKPPTFVD